MIFEALSLSGAFLIKPERRSDERGYFARTFCQREFGELGLPTEFAQCSSSFNLKAGTLRGMHFQKSPGMEAKLVRVTRGSVFDVLVDLRRASPTFGKWLGFELSAENGHSLFIPRGFAHGFQTLQDHTEVYYQITAFYEPNLAAGFSFSDPQLAIPWPVSNPITNEADRGRPLFAEIQPL